MKYQIYQYPKGLVYQDRPCKIAFTEDDIINQELYNIYQHAEPIPPHPSEWEEYYEARSDGYWVEKPVDTPITQFALNIFNNIYYLCAATIVHPNITQPSIHSLLSNCQYDEFEYDWIIASTYFILSLYAKQNPQFKYVPYIYQELISEDCEAFTSCHKRLQEILSSNNIPTPQISPLEYKIENCNYWNWKSLTQGYDSKIVKQYYQFAETDEDKKIIKEAILFNNERDSQNNCFCNKISSDLFNPETEKKSQETTYNKKNNTTNTPFPDHTINATTVNIFNVNGTNQYINSDAPNLTQTTSPTNSNHVASTLEDEIITYVKQLNKNNNINPVWTTKYENLWRNIIHDDTINKIIFNYGQQKNTHFNRNLVGNIIGYLNTHGIYADLSQAKTAEILEGSSSHSIRQQIDGNKLDKNIKTSINNIIEKLK